MYTYEVFALCLKWIFTGYIPTISKRCVYNDYPVSKHDDRVI